MSSLVPKGSTTKGLFAGIASALVPGSGQIINGQSDKGLGMATVAIGSGIVAWLGLPLISTVASVVWLGTAGYSAIDAYLTGKGK